MIDLSKNYQSWKSIRRYVVEGQRVLRLATVLDRHPDQVRREFAWSCTDAAKSIGSLVLWIEATRQGSGVHKIVFSTMMLKSGFASAIDLVHLVSTTRNFMLKRHLVNGPVPPKYEDAHATIRSMERLKRVQGFTFTNLEQMVKYAIVHQELPGSGSKGTTAAETGVAAIPNTNDPEFAEWRSTRELSYNIRPRTPKETLDLLVAVLKERKLYKMAGIPLGDMLDAVFKPHLKNFAELIEKDIGPFLRTVADNWDLSLKFRSSLESRFHASVEITDGQDPTVTLSVTLGIACNRLLNLYLGRHSPASIGRYLGNANISSDEVDLRAAIDSEVNSLFIALRDDDIGSLNDQSMLRLKNHATNVKGVIYSILLRFFALHECAHLLLGPRDGQQSLDGLDLEKQADAWAVGELDRAIRNMEADRNFVIVMGNANKEVGSDCFSPELFPSNPEQMAVSTGILAISLFANAGRITQDEAEARISELRSSPLISSLITEDQEFNLPDSALIQYFLPY